MLTINVSVFEAVKHSNVSHIALYRDIVLTDLCFKAIISNPLESTKN